MNQQTKLAEPVNIGDRCIECGCSTAPGSGNYVNRIPASNEFSNGFLCVECQSVECDGCGELTLEYDMLDDEILCSDCL